MWFRKFNEEKGGTCMLNILNIEQFLKVLEDQKEIGRLEVIEQLEQKIAPDGGETVLPLPSRPGKLPKR